MKTRLSNYCPNISVEAIFMNMENSKANEPHKFVLNLSQRFNLKSSKVRINMLLFKTYLLITH